jgi:hypothetical protein
VVSFTNALDALGCMVAAGHFDVGLNGAAQVDKFGNVDAAGIRCHAIGNARERYGFVGSVPSAIVCAVGIFATAPTCQGI